MTIRTLLSLAALLACVFPSLASADSGSLPIAGWVHEGDAITSGDFSIKGPSLSLSQFLLDGPDTLPIYCTVGSVCNFSFTLTADSSGSCGGYCTAFDSGTFRNKTAQWLVPDLTFKGSAFYNGSSFMTVPLTVSGTITAYQLVNCLNGEYECSLGPEVFSLSLDGTTSGQYDMGGPATGTNQAVVRGVYVSLHDDATVVPEPGSLTLVGTGLLWFSRRLVLRK